MAHYDTQLGSRRRCQVQCSDCHSVTLRACDGRRLGLIKASAYCKARTATWTYMSWRVNLKSEKRPSSRPPTKANAQQQCSAIAGVVLHIGTAQGTAGSTASWCTHTLVLLTPCSRLRSRTCEPNTSTHACHASQGMNLRFFCLQEYTTQEYNDKQSGSCQMPSTRTRGTHSHP